MRHQDWRKRKLRRFIYRYKRLVGCQRCGYRKNVAALQFHHRPGEVKVDTVGRLAQRRGIAAVRAEIRKCELLCGNCHAEHHNPEGSDAEGLR